MLLARAVGFLATLFLLVPVFLKPLTMVSDPSQSQGLLASSTAPGFRQDEGLHAVHNHAWDAPQFTIPRVKVFNLLTTMAGMGLKR